MALKESVFVLSHEVDTGNSQLQPSTGPGTHTDVAEARAQWRVAGRDVANFLPPVESSLAFHSVSPRQRMRRLLYRLRAAVSRLAALLCFSEWGRGVSCSGLPPATDHKAFKRPVGKAPDFTQLKTEDLIWEGSVKR